MMDEETETHKRKEYEIQRVPALESSHDDDAVSGVTKSENCTDVILPRFLLPKK